MTITAYVQGSNDPTMLGNLKDGGTLTVEGVTYDIPERGHYGPERNPSRMAPHRIAAALESAGYLPQHKPLGPPSPDGVYEIEVSKA
jgi:hypothetical protein